MKRLWPKGIWLLYILATLAMILIVVWYSGKLLRGLESHFTSPEGISLWPFSAGSFHITMLLTHLI